MCGHMCTHMCMHAHTHTHTFKCKLRRKRLLWKLSVTKGNCILATNREDSWALSVQALGVVRVR